MRERCPDSLERVVIDCTSCCGFARSDSTSEEAWGGGAWTAPIVGVANSRMMSAISGKFFRVSSLPDGTNVMRTEVGGR